MLNVVLVLLCEDGRLLQTLKKLLPRLHVATSAEQEELLCSVSRVDVLQRSRLCACPLRVQVRFPPSLR